MDCCAFYIRECMFVVCLLPTCYFICFPLRDPGTDTRCVAAEYVISTQNMRYERCDYVYLTSEYILNIYVPCCYDKY